MKTRYIIALSLVGFTGLFLIGKQQQLPQAPQVQALPIQTTVASQSQMQRVYEICNQSRMVASDELEQDCGAAQDATNTEFLCSANNSSPDTNCWVEAK